MSEDLIFTDLLNDINVCHIRLADLKRNHMAAINVEKETLSKLNYSLRLRQKGLKEDKIQRASKLICMDGEPENRFRVRAIHVAATDVVVGFKVLRKEFIGTKIDSFLKKEDEHEERVTCEYGENLIQGYVAFSIGLTKYARENVDNLTDLERDDILYFLLNAESIGFARAAPELCLDYYQ